jgi:hypothetical protein
MPIYGEQQALDTFRKTMREQWMAYTVSAMEYERMQLYGLDDDRQAADVATHLCMLWKLMFPFVKGSNRPEMEKEFMYFEKYVEDNVKLLGEMMMELIDQNRTRAQMERAVQMAMYENKIFEIG